MTTIRPLVPDDADAYFALRRRMLAEEPFAFLASAESDRASSPDAVREALATDDESRILGAFDPELVGAVGFYREHHPKAAHKLSVWGMYVAPEGRGCGVGRALMKATMRAARELEGIDLVHLAVNERAPAARAMYESLGFRVWGTEDDAIRVEGESAAEHHMVLVLADSGPRV